MGFSLNKKFTSVSSNPTNLPRPKLKFSFLQDTFLFWFYQFYTISSVPCDLASHHECELLGLGYSHPTTPFPGTTKY